MEEAAGAGLWGRLGRRKFWELQRESSAISEPKTSSPSEHPIRAPGSSPAPLFFLHPIIRHKLHIRNITNSYMESHRRYNSSASSVAPVVTRINDKL